MTLARSFKARKGRRGVRVARAMTETRAGFNRRYAIVKALKDRNRPVEYILFEDEGHGFVKLNNRLRLYPQIVEFLDKYLK